MAALFIIVLNWKKIQMPINWWTAKQTTVQMYSRIQLRNEKELMNVKRYVKRKKPDARDCELYDSICVTFCKRQWTWGQKRGWWRPRLEEREGAKRYRNTLRADCGTGYTLHTPAKLIWLYTCTPMKGEFYSMQIITQYT